jgi:hypothetical protein
MKTKLSFVLFFVFQSMLMSFPNTQYLNKSAEPRKLKYSYIVETDLPVREFYGVFCERLIAKYNWHKVFSKVETDDSYTGVFSFRDKLKNSWRCELKIKKVKNTSNKISVEMFVNPLPET